MYVLYHDYRFLTVLKYLSMKALKIFGRGELRVGTLKSKSVVGNRWQQTVL